MIGLLILGAICFGCIEFLIYALTHFHSESRKQGSTSLPSYHFEVAQRR